MNCCERNCGDEGKLDLQHTVYLFDGFQLDVTRRKLVSSGGLVQSLNSRAMDALLLLVANAGELVEKRRLMQTVWPNSIVEDNNLNQCVLAIRKALGETAGSNRYIMTVPGRGYRFVCPVRQIAQVSSADTPAPAPQRQRTASVVWITIAGMVCALLLAIVLMRVATNSSRQSASAANSPGPDGDVPELHLQLRGPLPLNGQVVATDLASLLAQCLATRPELRLVVQVQLVTDRGEPAWTGNYHASVGNRRTSLLVESPEHSGCQGLTGAATQP